MVREEKTLDAAAAAAAKDSKRRVQVHPAAGEFDDSNLCFAMHS
jgi:hypothetical protein